MQRVPENFDPPFVRTELRPPSATWTGVAFALAAGALWGLVFVGPLLLPDYPASLQTFGRYVAFGLIAVPLAWLDRKELAQLSRADWVEALKLAAVGNLLYYFCLASAIQRAGAPFPTMLIGTLPVVIAIAANLRDYRRDGRLPWGQLVPSLLLVAAGVACVNHVELALLDAERGTDTSRYLSGILLAVGAVACWTWYPLRNADWLRNHPGRSPRAWTTAQGVATLPLALAGYLTIWFWLKISGNSLPMPFGPRPLAFLGLMLALALVASWLGTLCWNEASQRMPTAQAGQLIVFETLAALSYAFLLRGQWPATFTAVGVVLMVGGVLWAVRIRPLVTNIAPADEPALN